MKMIGIKGTKEIFEFHLNKVTIDRLIIGMQLDYFEEYLKKLDNLN